MSLNDEEWRFLENHSVNVGFSIDGYKELHDKNRGNSFDNAMHNVEEYKRVTGHYPTFNATVGEDSLLNTDKVINFFKPFGVRVTFSRMIGYGILISDINDIRECLSAGILVETSPGRLASTFGKMESLFVGCLSVDDMLSRIKKVRKNKKFISDDKRLEYVSHISYYAVTKDEINELEQALNDLEELASFFYEDFEKRPNNFKAFYKKLKQYLQEEILDERDLGDEFIDIINRVLTRLDEVENIDASASFECLKSTMSLYLVQETKPGKSANWIVRNYEQIDGDVLRTAKDSKSQIMHFACLTDEDIDAVKALVVVPTALKEQWKSELLLKFNIPEGYDSNNNYLLVKSIDDITSEDLGKSWDFIIVDEVHKFLFSEREYKKLHVLSEKTKNLLLLSATPVQQKKEEYLDLLRLLLPRKYDKYSVDEFGELIGKQSRIIQKTVLILDDLSDLEETIQDVEKDGEDPHESEDCSDLIEEIQSDLEEICEEIDDQKLSDLLKGIDVYSDDMGVYAIKVVISYICGNYQIESNIIRNRRKILESND